jgi:hypothetical protein
LGTKIIARLAGYCDVYFSDRKIESAKSSIISSLITDNEENTEEGKSAVKKAKPRKQGLFALRLCVVEMNHPVKGRKTL